MKSYGNYVSLDLFKLLKIFVCIGKKGKLVSNIGKKGELVSNIEKKGELVSNIERKDELVSNIEKKDELVSNIGKEGELVKICIVENVDGFGLLKITRLKKLILYKGRSVVFLFDFLLFVKKIFFCRIRNILLIMKNVYKSIFIGDVEIVDRGDGDVEIEI